MLRRHLLVLLAVSVQAVSLFGSEAQAVMGTPTIMARIDKNGDGALSLAEVRAAAERKYDLIESKNGGHVTALQLGGRVSNKDLQAIGLVPGLSTKVSKKDFLLLTDKFFHEADPRKKAGASPGSGRLTPGDLMTPSGKNLIGLLQ